MSSKDSFRIAVLAGIAAIGAMINYELYGKIEAIGFVWVAWLVFIFFTHKLIMMGVHK